jgi:hypothetical protein
MEFQGGGRYYFLGRASSPKSELSALADAGMLKPIRLEALTANVKLRCNQSGCGVFADSLWL